MTKRSVVTRRKCSRRRKGGGRKGMFATLATLAVLCYLRQKVKVMWHSGNSRYIFYFMGLLAIASTLAVGVYTYHNPTSFSAGSMARFMRNRTSVNPKTVGVNAEGAPATVTAAPPGVVVVPLVNVRDGVVTSSMKTVIHHINNLLRPYKQCAFLDYVKIVHAELSIREYGKPVNTKSLNLLDEELNKWSTMHLKFQTTPGHAAFLVVLTSSRKGMYDKVQSIEHIKGKHADTHGNQVYLNGDPSAKFCKTSSPNPILDYMCVCEKNPEHRKDPYPNV